MLPGLLCFWWFVRPRASRDTAFPRLDRMLDCHISSYYWMTCSVDVHQLANASIALVRLLRTVIIAVIVIVPLAYVTERAGEC